MSNPETFETLSDDFVKFFQECKSQSFTKKEMDKICAPLDYRFKLNHIKRFVVPIAIVFGLIWVCVNVNFLYWTISAIGRLVMINLLPIWDWPALHNAKCLISYKSEILQNNDGYLNDGQEIDSKNCALCEYLDHVETVSNVKFYEIQEAYLEKGHPIIINNSHSPRNFLEFSHQIASSEDYINTDPCDVESSFLLSRFVSIDDLLQKSISSTGENDSWFFHLRNCQFEGVKASRTFIQRLPYHPTHLAPFYSSWLLMSSHIITSEKQLYLEGVVIIMQIAGQLDLMLTAKNPCAELCGKHQIVLVQGEALVFLTDLWKFSYILDNFDLSATIITETRW